MLLKLLIKFKRLLGKKIFKRLLHAIDIKAIKKEISQDGENLARGVIEAGSIFGSVAGLAILAPIVSHPIIHPVMKALGFDAPQKPEQKPLEEKK